ncbi:MAG: tRNA pseudouridine(55) synthase TruB [Phascolarctobacterium sp.]|nr:tRNA pseudouridine(55) synthase TruB [Phascolarctobacterium sp.]
MDGVFNVLKPPAMTSHDVVAFLRRALQTKKIGHGGTLDPDAAGVLPVFAGSATRLLEFAVEGQKEYLVELTLGKRTDTGDDSGTVIEELPVPALEQEAVEMVLKNFLGPQMQVPPMYSALKVDGKKLYELARKGIEVEREARPIEIYKLELMNLSADKLTMAVQCSKGTYIRVLVEDIARALGTCGTMSFLLRTQVGQYLINDAHTLQEIAENPEACKGELLGAVAHLPKLKLTGRQAARITNGVKTTIRGTEAGRYVLLGPGDEFLGLGTVTEEMVKADKILQHYVYVEE